MSDSSDVEIPTPYEGWTVVADAFDARRDPNGTDDFEIYYQSGHGRLQAALDVRVDDHGKSDGLIQFVHRQFATDLTSPRLAALLTDAFGIVREHQREPAYLEVEHYEDGYTLVGVILDAAALDELHGGVAGVGMRRDGEPSTPTI